MVTMPESAERRPDHVPPALVWQGSFEAFVTAEPDPFRRIGCLHDGPDILWVPTFFGGVGGRDAGWLLTRHAHIREVLADTGNFGSGTGHNMLGIIGFDHPLIPLELDPPHQQRYRKVLEPFFSPAAINQLDSAIRKACEQLIGEFSDPGGCEFIGEFAEKFPSHVFLDLMGMPRARLADFLKWERGMLRGQGGDEIMAAMTAILDYLKRFLAEQEQAPTSPLMQGIVSARLDDGRPLSTEEKISVCYLLYIGGLDTVYSTLGWIIWHLAQDAALQDRLRACPADIVPATEELLRAYSAASTARIVRNDIDFHGVRMRAGDRVKLLLSLASRDPLEYDDPHAIDIDRKSRHIAFGTGPHTCLGLRLAKREIRIVIETMLARFTDIRLGSGTSHEYHVGSVFGIDRLLLEWTGDH